ncbi:MAG: divergent PAP2 family protein [Spirochaetales bacterium]|nr:divergent PAP2 family protein [Spirochaetales bacterium]MCF7937152.1 divergent PAP2 family protein [Spirochaetales bacterium]
MDTVDSTSLHQLIVSPFFLSAFFSWFAAQFIKTLIFFFSRKHKYSQKIFITLFWTTGGMPSSHSALVTGIATSLGLGLGVDHPLFIVMVFYGLLIVRDSLGVRRAAGAQARSLNQLGRRLQKDFNIEWEPVKEVHGHNAMEVLVGIGLGFATALAVYLS